MNKKHYHVWDIPKSIFPRTKGNKAKNYADEVGVLLNSLGYTETKVQQSSLISAYTIKSMFSPTCSPASIQEVVDSVQDFMYHYENFCTRAYSIREKFVHLLNSILEIDYPEKEIDINKLLKIPEIKKSGFKNSLKRFDSIKSLREVIEERNRFTHRLRQEDIYLRPLPIPNIVNRNYSLRWVREVQMRAKRVYNAYMAIADINHIISNEIVKRKSDNTQKTKK